MASAYHILYEAEEDAVAERILDRAEFRWGEERFDHLYTRASEDPAKYLSRYMRDGETDHLHSRSAFPRWRRRRQLPSLDYVRDVLGVDEYEHRLTEREVQEQVWVVAAQFMARASARFYMLQDEEAFTDFESMMEDTWGNTWYRTVREDNFARSAEQHRRGCSWRKRRVRNSEAPAVSPIFVHQDCAFAGHWQVERRLIFE